MDTEAPPQVTVHTVDGDDRVIGALIAGRFRLVQLLGDGAMGRVYLAEHEGLHRRVALKFLHDELTGNSEIAARFAREAVAAARIEHPNVITVYDSGTDERGRCFLVMEYCEGEELRALLTREDALPRERALGVARQIAAALDHAHSMGIVHRDIKPENVLVLRREDAGDAVKVIDFGIAKVYQPEGPSATGSALTRAGIVLGTPEYMAPEQALGASIDHRADLYAFAVTTYEMLTGKRPFDDEDIMAVLMRHIHAPPPPPSSMAPAGSIPLAVDEVFAQALAKAPADRHASANAFVDALERAFSAPAPAPTPTMVVQSAPHEPASPAERIRESIVVAGDYARESYARVTTAWDGAPSRTRRALAVAGATLALLMLVVAVRWARRDAPADAAPSATHPAAARVRASSPPVSISSLQARIDALRANTDLATNTPAARHRTAVALEAMRSRDPDDAAVAYVLADLYARNPSTGAQSLALYREALLDAPELARDEALADDVLRIYAANPALSAPAEAMFRGALAEVARPRLVELAARGGAGHGRAAAVLSSPPFAGRLDATERALLALSTARTCEAKRAEIEALGRDGDARALPTLRRIPTGSGCGFLGLGRCNTCLGTSVPLAIHAIEARSPDGG